MATPDESRRRTWRFRLDDATTLGVSTPPRATEKQIRRRGRWSLVLGALIVTATFAAVAYADNTAADGDGLSPIGNNDLALGTICVNQETTATVLLGAVRNGNYPGPQVWANSATVTFSVQSATGTGLSASMNAGETSVALPSDWADKVNNTVQGTAKSTVSVTPTSTGSYSGSVVYRGSGTGSQGGTVNRDDTMAVTANVINCAPANTAPTAPGKPAPTPASPNKGGFTLNWTASTDDGNPDPPGAITYELQGKDADDAAFAGVTSASALATNSYTFASGQPAEGTWTYRVRASDSALTSDWSDSSDPIVVDRTAPTFGACPAGGPFLLNSGNQSVGPITANDGNLPDGSAGSGVNAGASTLSGTVDTSSVGSKQVTFTAVDNAANSDTKQCSYSVIYDWSGFFSPVENPNAWNAAKAGQSIPVKFSLAGDQGLNIFASGYPKVYSVACPNGGVTPDPIEEYATATANSKLIYDALADQYNYVWKTEKSWATKCFRLDVKLNDETTHSAYFQFTK